MTFGYGQCIRCMVTFIFDTETVPSVYVHDDTRCIARPDGTSVNPGVDTDIHREALCPACAPIIAGAIGTLMPLRDLFPHARHDLIKPR